MSSEQSRSRSASVVRRIVARALRPARDGLFYLRYGRDVSQQRCVDPFGPAVGVVVVVDGKDPEPVVHLFGRGQFAVVYGVEDGLDFAFGDILPGDVEPAAAAVVAFRRFSPVEHRAQRRHDEAVVESDAPFEGRRADDRLLVDVRRGVGSSSAIAWSVSTALSIPEVI